jgi:hypothetical protein
MEFGHAIDSLAHIVWVQIALLCVTGVSVCSAAILININRRLSKRVDSLTWTVKFLNRKKGDTSYDKRGVS